MHDENGCFSTYINAYNYTLSTIVYYIILCKTFGDGNYTDAHTFGEAENSATLWSGGTRRDRIKNDLKKKRTSTESKISYYDGFRGVFGTAPASGQVRGLHTTALNTQRTTDNWQNMWNAQYTLVTHTGARSTYTRTHTRAPGTSAGGEGRRRPTAITTAAATSDQTKQRASRPLPRRLFVPVTPSPTAVIIIVVIYIGDGNRTHGMGLWGKCVKPW